MFTFLPVRFYMAGPSTPTPAASRSGNLDPCRWISRATLTQPRRSQREQATSRWVTSRALDGTLRPLFEKWYPGLANDNSAGNWLGQSAK
jgi:hypothetical protein